MLSRCDAVGSDQVRIARRLPQDVEVVNAVGGAAAAVATVAVVVLLTLALVALADRCELVGRIEARA